MVSPRYSHRKLEPPFYRDVVDVFEDRMRGWLLSPAQKLLESGNHSIAAVALVTNYFEGIEIYLSGEDSDRQSRRFFSRGFRRVFVLRGYPDSIAEAIADSLYEMLRCGFAHDGMFRVGILFSTLRDHPILVTLPKKDGLFAFDAKPASIVIDPRRFVEGVELHFNDYVKRLRRGTDLDLKRKFESAVAIKWKPEAEGPTIGLTEEEFVSGAYATARNSEPGA